MRKLPFNLLMLGMWSFITALNTVNAYVYYESHDKTLGLYPFLLTTNILLVLIYGFQALFALLEAIKIKLYVYQNGKYMRVVGPKGLIDSLGGWFGHIVIGDRYAVNSGAFYSADNEIGNRSVNGYGIDQMQLKPIDRSDEKELGLTEEKPKENW